MDETIIDNDEKDVLFEISAEDRKKQLVDLANKKASFRKNSAKTAVSLYDNLDAIFGTIEKIFLLVLAEFIRRGDWISAICFCLLTLVVWILKVRRPVGPFISCLKQEPQVIRAKLVSLTKTVYKGI